MFKIAISLENIGIYDTQTLIKKKMWVVSILTQTFFQKYIIVVLTLFLLKTDLMSLITFGTVSVFSVGKELYVSVLILTKLWLILYVAALFSLVRYLIVS